MKFISIAIFIFYLIYPCVEKVQASSSILKMTDAMGKIYWVSSELDRPQNGLGRYGAQNLFDQNDSTAWVEGRNHDGIGEKIVVLNNGVVSHLQIVNGYAKNRKIFMANNRIRELRIKVYNIRMPSEGNVTENAVPVVILDQELEMKTDLKDQPETQLISLPRKVDGNFAFELTIASVYKGTKYRDTCLSELQFINQPDKIFIKNNDHEIWVGNKLVRKNEKEVYQLIETSKGGAWAILISMPAQVEGRAETSYLLFSIEKKHFVTVDNMTELYGFKEIDGRLFLEGFSNKKNKIVSVDLQELNI